MACRRNGYWAIPPSTPTTSAPTSGPSTPRPSSPRILRGPTNCRSTNTSTRKGIWSNAASTSSSTSGAWQPVTRRLRGTSSPSSPSRLSPCGSDDCQQDLELDVGRADDLAPFLGFVGNDLAEVGGRAGNQGATEVGQPDLQLGIGEAGIGFLVQLLDDLVGRFPGPADAIPRARLIARHEFAHGR